MGDELISPFGARAPGTSREIKKRQVYVAPVYGMLEFYQGLVGQEAKS